MNNIFRYCHVVAASLVLVLTGIPAQAAAASTASSVEFLRDFTIAVPPGWKAPVRLLVPPVSDTVLDKMGPSAPLFAVGPADAVWFGIERNVLIHATKGYPLQLGVPFSDIAIIDGGGLLVATDGAIGFVVINVAPGTTPGDGQMTAAFQPIFTLPVTGAHLSAGANGSLYVFGRAKEGGRNDVYLMAPEAVEHAPAAPRALRTLRKVFSTTENIAAVAGNGDETYVATGRLVVKVSRAKKGIVAVLLHPKEPVLGLALTHNGLLFYATSSGVGVVSAAGAVEFVKAANVAIRSVGDDLYILLRNSFAVVKVEGTGAFRTAMHPASPKP
jgi:hypothetical protein